MCDLFLWLKDPHVRFHFMDFYLHRLPLSLCCIKYCFDDVKRSKVFAIVVEFKNHPATVLKSLLKDRRAFDHFIF